MQRESKDKRTKILFVIDGLEFGGGERGFAQLINGLPTEEYQIFLAFHQNRQLRESVTNPLVQFLCMDFSKKLNFSLLIKLVRIIRLNKIEITHGQGGRAELYARLANKLAGRSSYVSTIQMPVEGYDVGHLRKKVYVSLDRLSERFVDQFLVVSEVLRNKMIQEHEIKPKNVVKIYNGVELDLYNSNETDLVYRNKIINKFGLDQSTILIGAIGRLVWQKGFEYLIRAIPKITKECPEAKFLIVGDGPLKDQLRVKSEKLKVADRIIFTGFRSDVDEILSAIDLLVIPSLLEGFPMITLEAMAVAKPIVATNIDGITEQIVNGENGILVPPRDPAALASAIIRLLSDRKSTQQMGIAARERVEREFSVERMVSETEKVYKALLNRNETFES